MDVTLREAIEVFMRQKVYDLQHFVQPGSATLKGVRARDKWFVERVKVVVNSVTEKEICVWLSSKDSSMLPTPRMHKPNSSMSHIAAPLGLMEMRIAAEKEMRNTIDMVCRKTNASAAGTKNM